MMNHFFIQIRWNYIILVNKLLPNVNALFGAGSETVRTTTEWLLLLMAKYPEHQKRVQDEIDSVIGNERSPSYADIIRMPFTQAFINEMLRWKTTVPLNLIRRYFFYLQFDHSSFLYTFQSHWRLFNMRPLYSKRHACDCKFVGST